METELAWRQRERQKNILKRKQNKEEGSLLHFYLMSVNFLEEVVFRQNIEEQI